MRAQFLGLAGEIAPTVGPSGCFGIPGQAIDELRSLFHNAERNTDGLVQRPLLFPVQHLGREGMPDLAAEAKRPRPDLGENATATGT